MRPHEALGDGVGIVVLVVNVLVVTAMFAAPHEHRVLEGGGAEEQDEQLDGPLGVKGDVREQPVVAQGDGHPGGVGHEEKHRDLEPVNAVVAEVNGHRRERQEQGADEEGTGDPVDAGRWGSV